jgi:hypothetical protein
MRYRMSIDSDLTDPPVTRSGGAAAQSNGSDGGGGNTGGGSGIVLGPSAAVQPKGIIQRLVSWSHLLLVAATNVPQSCVSFVVPPGCVVRARANNGTLAGNAAVIFVALDPTTLRRGMGTPLNPLDDVSFPVDNTCKVWAMGAIGDGVVISVTTQGNN